MNSFVEIYLSEGAHPPVLIDVEQMRSFDPVANRKRNLLEDLPANRIFPTKGLEELSEFRVKEGEHGPDENFGDPPSAGSPDVSAGVNKWPFVERFYVVGITIEEKGSNERINKAGMDIANVCVHKADDVAGELIDALPQVLTLASFESKARKNIA